MYRNLTLLTDLYQLTMMQGYFSNRMYNREVVFEMFYRKNPSNNGYAICAGLEQVIDYIQNLEFTSSDIDYLESLNLFTPDFLDYLTNLRFSGDIDAIEEGTVVFPMEPLIRITGPILEAQLVETMILNIINHQSLIATKASRVVSAAENDTVLEFGLRRAQGPDAGIYGARAAIIGGCHGTSNVLAGYHFDVPVSGTHAHSWVMNFDNEIDAFKTYADTFPSKAILLVDTYDTLNSGVANAIKVFNTMKQQNLLNGTYGIRLDSGDLAYISKKAREMLDEAGHQDAIISASSDLDEYLIIDLKRQGAQIDIWGVGTKLITSDDCPAFGGVYKIAAEKDEKGNLIPKIKISDNIHKVTNPGVKKIIRVYDNETKKIKADVIALSDETFNEDGDWVIRDQNARWKKMRLVGGKYTIRELLVPVFRKGKCIYKCPSVMEIREYAKQELDTLWDEFKRLTNPEVLPVDLSDDLYYLKERMLNEYRKGEI
ncbi:MAG: nicotinate phosphoribosyltransferase [Epulopiscium sp. Nele67-Bin004]|nr:MAG: nicotinate phosphoribosyltransferase [Epulopiscium sp. Nele67-Bin004]